MRTCSSPMGPCIYSSPSKQIQCSCILECRRPHTRQQIAYKKLALTEIMRSLYGPFSKTFGILVCVTGHVTPPLLVQSNSEQESRASLLNYIETDSKAKRRLSSGNAFKNEIPEIPGPGKARFLRKARGSRSVDSSIFGIKDSTMKAKPCLGGWRHKVTGAIYWSACTQTGPQEDGMTVERTAQTEYLVDKCTVTHRDVGVQSCCFPDATDRFIESSPPDHSPEKILESVVKIQRFYRAHRGRIAAGQRHRCLVRSHSENNQQIPAEPRSYRSRDFVILNRSSPRTRTDFELLYNLLDRWRASSLSALSVPALSRTVLCSLILSKEVELLRAIDSLKTATKLRKRERSYRKFLDEMSKPAVWRNRFGSRILVDTPRSALAGTLKNRFDELSREDVSTEERLETLYRLGEDVQLHTCRVSDAIVRLLNQEIDLISSDIDIDKLSWLRSRLKIAFLTFARDTLSRDKEDCPYPKFNRQICRSCGRLLPLDKFVKEKRYRSSSCNYCLYVRVRTGARIVYGPYECLLRDVKRNEARLNSYSSLAFVIDSKIVYHLVNDIWHGRSAISENDRLSELRLVRFRPDSEWSPWNCLLLTAREAAVHRRVEDPGKFYGPMILQKFHTRNLQAKVQFESVAGIERSWGKKSRY
ncbi:IQ motif and ubiquitin-like domain-containing protein [Halictus rubicundus]|uniref:IQ motif and ubiquitin-like domain-containing protein n=1 Tax=Halictus rubicundus TaxID=77578 RepID=UPI004035DB93